MNLFEIDLLNSLHDALQCPFFDFIMPKISFLGNAGMVWIAAAVAMLFFRKTRKCGITLAVGLIFCLVFNNLLLKNIVARERPFAVDPSIKLLISKPGEYSFPSGHTLSSFMAATVLMYYDRRRFGWAALALATLIGFTRLYLRVHYFTDVICGALIGVAFGFAAIYAVKKAASYISSRRAANSSGSKR